MSERVSRRDYLGRRYNLGRFLPILPIDAMGGEDFTGCKFVCPCAEAESLGLIGGFDRDVTLELVDKVAKGGWGQVYLAQVDGGAGGFAACKVSWLAG